MLALMRGDLAMDGVSFDTWLDAIRLLTARQRQEGFMYLALAEGDDEAASVLFDASPVSVDGVSAVVDGKPLGARIMVESDEPPMPVSAAAQSRVESTGCPHCASRRLHRWGHASDLPRYRCRDCGRTFNGLTSTPLAHLRKKDRWEALVHFRTKGEMAPTPSCYAMTGWRRTESGRPAISIRFSTATPMAASVCWAAKPRARSRGPINAL